MSYPRISRGPMAADILQRDFTQIHNRLFRDPRLSFKAKGIFGLISTHRDGYGVSAEWIADASTDGVSAVKTGLRELERYGYLERRQEVRPDGTRGAMTYAITDMPSSEPPVENRPPAATCVNTEKRRSEPLVENPPAVHPLADDRAHKKTSNKNTTDENTRTAPFGRVAPPDARRASTGSKAAGDTGGCAASGKTKPRKLTREERRAIDAVWLLLPAALTAAVPRQAVGLEAAILDALAPGQPAERTPEQLVTYRVTPRWNQHWAARFFAGEVDSPVGALRAMLKRDPLCSDARCDEHVQVDTGEACRACERTREDQRTEHRPAAAPRPATAEETHTPPKYVPMQTAQRADYRARAAEVRALLPHDATI